MNNESGYMTAFSMILAFILISVIVSNLKILDSERQFNEKRLSWFEANVTLELAREDVLAGLYSEQIGINDSNTLTYKYGTVEYQVNKLNTKVFIVRMDVQLNDGGKRIGLLYYDYVNQKLDQWVVL